MAFVCLQWPLFPCNQLIRLQRSVEFASQPDKSAFIAIKSPSWWSSSTAIPVGQHLGRIAAAATVTMSAAEEAMTCGSDCDYDTEEASSDDPSFKETDFVCLWPDCESRFDFKCDLTNHIRFNHLEQNKTPGNAEKYIGYPIKQGKPVELKKKRQQMAKKQSHLHTRAGPSTSTSISAVDGESGKKVPQEMRPLACRYYQACKARFSCLHEKQSHERYHENAMIYFCRTCSFKAARHFYMRDHIIRKHANLLPPDSTIKPQWDKLIKVRPWSIKCKLTK